MKYLNFSTKFIFQQSFVRDNKRKRPLLQIYFQRRHSPHMNIGYDNISTFIEYSCAKCPFVLMRRKIKQIKKFERRIEKFQQQEEQTQMDNQWKFNGLHVQYVPCSLRIIAKLICAHSHLANIERSPEHSTILPAKKCSSNLQRINIIHCN